MLIGSIFTALDNESVIILNGYRYEFENYREYDEHSTKQRIYFLCMYLLNTCKGRRCIFHFTNKTI